MSGATLGMPSIRGRSVVGVWMRHYEAFRRYWQINMTWVLVEPLVVLIAVGFGIGRLVGAVEGAPTYAIFVTPGIIIGSAMFMISEAVPLNASLSHLIVTIGDVIFGAGFVWMGFALWSEKRELAE